jgi:hypothetical protein
MGLSIGSDIYQVTKGPRPPAGLIRFYAAWDGTLRLATQTGRGVFLKFDGFSGGTLQEALAQTIYFRGVYGIYPLPVLVTTDDVIVGEGKDFLIRNSYPNDQWLINHGVGSVLTIGFDARKRQPYVESVRWLGN